MNINFWKPVSFAFYRAEQADFNVKPLMLYFQNWKKNKDVYKISYI